MRLDSRDGGWLDLTVLRRQRVEVRGRRPEDDWATDWLVVRGEVSVPAEPVTGAGAVRSGTRWAFREPCLTPWEGQRLGSWLRAVAGRGDGPAVRPGTGLRFREPMLSFVLDAARDARRLVRVQLTGAAAPPAASGTTGGDTGGDTGAAPGEVHRLGGGVLLDVDAVGLRRAAADWTAAIGAADRP